jgi:hypothetical protein
MNVTRTKCPITMLKFSKSQISRNFGPLIEHGPHWINFIIFTFTSEKNRYFGGLYKIWNRIILFDMRKKKVKCKTCHGKSEEKCGFKSPWNGFLGLKWGIPIILGPIN